MDMLRALSLLIFMISALPAYAQEGEAEEALPNVKWSHDRGVVEDSFELTLSAEPPGSAIRYTLDGTKASSDQGTPYTDSILIDRTMIVRAIATNADGSSKVETRSFLFVDQVKDQEAFPEGYVTEIVSRRNGPDRPHTFDWAMDLEVLDDVANNGDLASHLKDIPTLSMVLEVQDLNFMFENQTRRGVDYEREGSLELIYPDTEAFAEFDGVQIDCGLRMQGGGAGDQARKKSFRVLFKKVYGEGALNYPLFESAVHFGGNGASRFDGVILRAGGNTNWSKDDAWKHEPSTYLRDPFVRDSQIAISGMGSRSVWVHFYINGFYFGLYNIAERPDEKFAASYLGGEVEDHYAINHGGTVAGDSSLWNDIVNGGLQNLHQADRYEAIQERIDVEALSDYLLLNWLVGMGDWPYNNFYGGMRNEPPGKIRFFSWDSEYAFWTLEGYLGSNPTAWVHPNFGSGGDVIPEIWTSLSKNQDFLITFADRVYRHCFNDGALTDANVQARFLRLADFIENAIVAESARWGDSSWGREDDPHTRANDFYPNRDAVVELMEGNVAIFIEALRDRGYYPDLDPPTLPSSREAVPVGFEIPMENPNSLGSIYYTLDGSDPRLPGGKISPNAIKHETGAPAPTITESTRVKVRVIRVTLFGAGTSSALNEQLYLTEPVGYPLRITELMYHPEINEALEFIEIQNVSEASLELTGFYITGIDYRFPAGTWLEPKQIIVLIPNDDPAAFSKVYPEVHIFATYRKHLANDGETITIHDSDDRVITSVTYDDDIEADWPESADGLGYSLVVRDPTDGASEAAGWRPSKSPGGTPGIMASMDIDSDKDGFTDSQEALAHTDPNDPSSFLKLEIARESPLSVRLSFRAEARLSYTLQSRKDLDSGAWQVVEQFPAEDAATNRTVDAVISVEDEILFYRLVIP